MNDKNSNVVTLKLPSEIRPKPASRMSHCNEACSKLDDLYREGKITAEQAMEQRAIMRAMLCY